MVDFKVGRTKELQERDLDPKKLEELLAREPPVHWLTERERLILVRYYGFCGNEACKEEMIADAVGVAHSRIGQILKRLLRLVEEYGEPSAEAFQVRDDMQALNFFTLERGAQVGLKPELLERVRSTIRTLKKEGVLKLGTLYELEQMGERGLRGAPRSGPKMVGMIVDMLATAGRTLAKE